MKIVGEPFWVNGQLLKRWSIGSPIPRGILKGMIRSLCSVNLDNLAGGVAQWSVGKIGVRQIIQRGGKRKTRHGLHGYLEIKYLIRTTVSTSTTENTDGSAGGAPPEFMETMSSGSAKAEEE